MGVEKSVADRANAQARESKSGIVRGNMIKRKTKSINPESRKPKGVNLRGGECRRGMTPPPRANSWQGVEKRKVVIIS